MMYSCQMPMRFLPVSLFSCCHKASSHEPYPDSSTRLSFRRCVPLFHPHLQHFTQNPKSYPPPAPSPKYPISPNSTKSSDHAAFRSTVSNVYFFLSSQLLLLQYIYCNYILQGTSVFYGPKYKYNYKYKYKYKHNVNFNHKYSYSSSRHRYTVILSLPYELRHLTIAE